MSNYSKTTDFASKDALATGNANKIVKGTEIDDEFNAIQTAIATKANTLSPTLTGTPLAPTAASGTNTTQIATTAFVTAADSAVTTAYTTADSALQDNIDALEAITITGDVGISGGGDLSENRTLSLDIDSLTALTNIDGTNDYIPIYDASATTAKKATVGGLVVVAESLSQDGYVKFANGLILQWGREALVGAGTTSTVTLPIAFPNNIFICFGGPSAINVGLDSSSCSAGKNGTSKSTILVTTDANGGGTTWIAIGN